MVTSQRDLKKFITFPEKLYKENKYWVPALIADEFDSLRKDRNSSFEFCDADYFLAYKDKEIVGRVAAIINNNANRDWKKKTVRFGWIDFIDDIEVTKALLKAVLDWGKERGMEEMKGPLGFIDLDKEGLLVEGFDKYPSITTIYNFPYYKEHFEKLGLVKDVDWIQRCFDLPEEIPEKIEKFQDIIKDRYGLYIYEPKNKKELKSIGIELFHVMNRAFTHIYEYTPLSEKQIKQAVDKYIPIVNIDFVCLVCNKEDKVVGYGITMPQLSEAVRKAKGRLFPFGFYHLLKGLNNYKTLESLMIGVDPEYHNKGFNSLMFSHLHKNSLKYGVKHVILNPQLETNIAALALFNRYNAQPYQRRRCFTAKLEELDKNLG